MRRLVPEPRNAGFFSTKVTLLIGRFREAVLHRGSSIIRQSDASEQTSLQVHQAGLSALQSFATRCIKVCRAGHCRLSHRMGEWRLSFRGELLRVGAEWSAPLASMAASCASQNCTLRGMAGRALRRLRGVMEQEIDGHNGREVSAHWPWVLSSLAKMPVRQYVRSSYSPFSPSRRTFSTAAAVSFKNFSTPDR